MDNDDDETVLVMMMRLMMMTIWPVTGIPLLFDDDIDIAKPIIDIIIINLFHY